MYTSIDEYTTDGLEIDGLELANYTTLTHEDRNEHDTDVNDSLRQHREE